MRIRDPALTGTSDEIPTFGQRIAAYAEVAIEPLSGAATSSAFTDSPLFRVVCTAACSEFERWKALAGSPSDVSSREVVLWFVRALQGVVGPDSLDPETGYLEVLARDTQGLRRVGGASYWMNLSARDRYASINEGTRAASESAASAGSADFFRNPPRVFAD